MPARILLFAWLLLGLGLASAWAQDSGADPRQDSGTGETFDFQALLERDRGVTFPPRAGQAALETLQSPSLLPAMRTAALFTLGETQTSSARQQVESWMKRGSVEERCAAVFAWGGMGTFLGGEDPFLVERLSDSELEVAEAALFALYKQTPAQVLDRLAFLVARPDEPLFRAAEHILEWHERGTCSRPGPVSHRLELRWQAARVFGAVDGQLWSAHLLDNLCEDRTFLDACLLPAAGELRQPQVRDHFAELLLREPGSIWPAVGALYCMPPELDRMVEEGIWLPSTDEQRNALLEAAEERGMTRLVPRLLARLALHPTMTLRVSGWLSAYDTTYQDVIDEHLRTRDAGLRAIAARSAGHASLSEWITRLRDLSRDDNPAVRLEALIARVRSGDAKAIPPLRGIFLSDRDQSSDGIRNRAMELMLDAHDSRVLDVASGIYTESPSDWERACLASILLESGRSANTALVRNALQGGLRPDFWHLHMIQALGHSSLSVDRVFLEDQYPSQGAVELNIALTQALLRAGSEEVLPVLRHAIWKGDLNRSFLAAALLGARFGDLRLMQWIERPPESATEQDLRRVGFLIGSLGGMEAVETLAGHLGAVVGVDRPELQGAMLGALSARTY